MSCFISRHLDRVSKSIEDSGNYENHPWKVLYLLAWCIIGQIPSIIKAVTKRPK